LILIKGQFNEAKVFTSELEETARAQIQNLVNQSFVKGSKIRVMPDVHAGAGSTIGTTMTIKSYFISASFLLCSHGFKILKIIT
jgi:tRNA-splicing ligase RtcB